MRNKLLAFSALAGLLAFAFDSCRHTHRRRLVAKPEQKPEPLQTWEGEGGQNQMLGEATGAVEPAR